MNNTVDVDTLLTEPNTKTFKYYGANCNQFKLGSIVYEVVEDEQDGYRSSMGALLIVENPTGIFSRNYIAMVFLRESCSQRYEVVDVEDGHVWLTFGTNDYDDYYPYFVFDPQPKPPNAQSK